MDADPLTGAVLAGSVLYSRTSGIPTDDGNRIDFKLFRRELLSGPPVEIFDSKGLAPLNGVKGFGRMVFSQGRLWFTVGSLTVPDSGGGTRSGDALLSIAPDGSDQRVHEIFDHGNYSGGDCVGADGRFGLIGTAPDGSVLTETALTEHCHKRVTRSSITIAGNRSDGTRQVVFTRDRLFAAGKGPAYCNAEGMTWGTRAVNGHLVIIEPDGRCRDILVAKIGSNTRPQMIGIVRGETGRPGGYYRRAVDVDARGRLVVTERRALNRRHPSMSFAVSTIRRFDGRFRVNNGRLVKQSRRSIFGSACNDGLAISEGAGNPHDFQVQSAYLRSRLGAITTLVARTKRRDDIPRLTPPACDSGFALFNGAAIESEGAITAFPGMAVALGSNP